MNRAAGDFPALLVRTLRKKKGISLQMSEYFNSLVIISTQ